MGIVFGGLLNALKSKVPQERVIAITDNVFGRLMDKAKKKAQAEKPSDTVEEKTKLFFQDLHSAIVEVFEELNKVVPRAKFQPPTREKVDEILKDYDQNKDKHIDREEFRTFVHKFTADLRACYAKDVLLVMVVVPTMALITKAATERVPVVGDFFARIPNTILALAAASSAAAATVAARMLFK